MKSSCNETDCEEWPPKKGCSEGCLKPEYRGKSMTAEVYQLEKRYEKMKELAGEVIASLELAFDRGTVIPEWSPHIKRWKKRLKDISGGSNGK